MGFTGFYWVLLGFTRFYWRKRFRLMAAAIILGFFFGSFAHGIVDRFLSFAVVRCFFFVSI